MSILHVRTTRPHASVCCRVSEQVVGIESHAPGLLPLRFPHHPIILLMGSICTQVVEPPPCPRLWTKNTFVHHLAQPILTRPLHPAKVVRILDKESNARRSLQPKTAGPGRNHNLDKRMGNPACVADLAKLMDLECVELAKMHVVETWPRLKSVTPWRVHLTHALWPPCTTGGVRHLCCLTASDSSKNMSSLLRRNAPQSI